MAFSLRRLPTHRFTHRHHTHISFLPSASIHRRCYQEKHSHQYSFTLAPYHSSHLLNNYTANYPCTHLRTLQKQRNPLHYHSKYYESNIPQQTIKNNTKKEKKEALERQKEAQKSTFLSYLNPIFLLTKTFNICYNIIYYTFDSIIHPYKGYQRLQNMWKSIKHFVKHFYEASKLMGTDIKAATKILSKMRKTGELTYRERRQLRRVTMDVLRFIPMLVIILIPALEIVVPFLLILFPNMLPSRFQTEHQKLERRKQILASRIGLTAFFEDTLHEFVNETKTKQESLKLIGNEKIESLEKLLEKVKNNEEISNNSILKLASLFDDEMALDNASASVLANMCRYMQLNHFGTQPMLRKRLYDKIRQIRKEDQGIRKDSLDSIPEQLLKALLRERGMRSDFEEWVLRANMNKWLELSLDHDVPVTLLVMSRIFTLQHIPGQDATEMLKGTISTIGDATTKEMLVEKGGMDDLKGEREIVEKQQQLIKEEEDLIADMDVSDRSDIVEKRRIREVAEAAETLTTENVTDPEKQEIEEIREKLSKIRDETEALWEELKDKSTIEMVIGRPVSDRDEVETSVGEADIMEFDIKEDEMDFIDVEQEMVRRSKVRDKIARRIEKSIEKESIEADQTIADYANTLKRFNQNDEDINEEELKSVLKTGIFTDKEIEEFLKELDVMKQKEPQLNLSQRIERLIDEFDEDIDIKDINKDKET